MGTFVVVNTFSTSPDVEIGDIITDTQEVNGYVYGYKKTGYNKDGCPTYVSVRVNQEDVAPCSPEEKKVFIPEKVVTLAVKALKERGSLIADTLEKYL